MVRSYISSWTSLFPYGAFVSRTVYKILDISQIAYGVIAVYVVHVHCIVLFAYFCNDICAGSRASGALHNGEMVRLCFV